MLKSTLLMSYYLLLLKYCYAISSASEKMKKINIYKQNTSSRISGRECEEALPDADVLADKIKKKIVGFKRTYLVGITSNKNAHSVKRYRGEVLQVLFFFFSNHISQFCLNICIHSMSSGSFKQSIFQKPSSSSNLNLASKSIKVSIT